MEQGIPENNDISDIINQISSLINQPGPRIRIIPNILFSNLIINDPTNIINSSFEEFNEEDPQEIVIDEVLGQLLTLLAIPIYETLYSLPIIYYCICAFLLFRLFDIWKPYPVNYIDDNVKGAFGIMFDDIFARFYSIIIMCLFFFYLGG